MIKITENYRTFIYHAKSLLVQQLGIVLLKKAVYFTHLFFSSLSIQEGGLFKRVVLSRAYGIVRIILDAKEIDEDFANFVVIYIATVCKFEKSDGMQSLVIFSMQIFHLKKM